MGRPNHYLVLGISRDEPAERIRTAYRELVKRYHPDRAGAVDIARFREVIEAYEVLSDSERRRRYNALLDRDDPTAPRVMPERRWPDAEPLANPGGPLFAEPMAVRTGFRVIRPSLEDLLARLRGAATGIGSPKRGRVDALHVEVLLAPEEAARGGVIDVAVPVPGWCWACRGGGETRYGVCRACGGEGVVERDVPVRAYLPGIARDATLDVPLRDAGLPDVVLQLHVRLAPWSLL
jgi:DnaJ-class molecular chaperone